MPDDDPDPQADALADAMGDLASAESELADAEADLGGLDLGSETWTSDEREVALRYAGALGVLAERARRLRVLVEGVVG